MNVLVIGKNKEKNFKNSQTLRHKNSGGYSKNHRINVIPIVSKLSFSDAPFVSLRKIILNISNFVVYDTIF